MHGDSTILRNPAKMAHKSNIDVLREIINHRRIHPFFQPIVDLFTGGIVGYEVLARGVAPLEMPEAMFKTAREADLVWDLDYLCRDAAFEAISNLPLEYRTTKFFINVNADIFGDDRFRSGFTLKTLEDHNIDQKNIVLEISEETSFYDFMLLEEQVRHYVKQGFTIALDDFGAGFSSIQTLIAVNPQFIKLDETMVRDIERHPSKQQMLRIVASFSDAMNGNMMAEGVETWDELEYLLRAGVRYAQGFLLASPALDPSGLETEVHKRLSCLVSRFHYAKVDLDESISHQLEKPYIVQRGSMTCEDLDRVFKHEDKLDHVIITNGDQPAGLVTRQHFYLSTGGPFGFSLFQKKAVEAIAKGNPLIVGNDLRITALAKLAMKRLPEDLYDPVIVVDDDGVLLGTVTIKQLLTRSTELEIKNARDLNPLTSLPGNRSILKWVQNAIETPPFAVIYSDLDRFKEFNDVYGFLMGDEMIRIAAAVLNEAMPMINAEANLGHVGGDDFIIVVNDLVEETPLAWICEEFDRRKRSLFRAEDLERGWYKTKDRNGNMVQIPLATLSLAIVTSNNLQVEPHPALLGQISASIKKRIKKINADAGHSGYLIDRRVYTV